MTATNHVVSGALLATFITNPIIAIPLAFLLHFVLDSLPHFGRIKSSKKSRVFKIIIFTDMTIAAAFLLSLVIFQPANWLLYASCGIACASPDLMWLPRWLNELKDVKNRPMNWIESFHSRIQWGERSWGWSIEIIWLLATYSLFVVRSAA